MPEASWTFQRDSIRSFHFRRATLDPATGTVELVYALGEGPELVERLRFPGAPFRLDAPRRRAVAAALRLLHLIAGVSYYKAAVPPRLVVQGRGLDPELAALVTLVYEKGLGEFAYRNGLSLRGRLRFAADGEGSPAAALGLGQGALVAIGGGKDSLVSIEMLRAAGVAQTLAHVGQAPLIAACAEATGLPSLHIERHIAPEIFDYNARGAWNGHVPVTAINSAILVVAALLLGHDQVVFSNERSASYGSLIPGTGEVNHQWSKGWEFEQAFADYVRGHVAADLQYFSLLRPFSELAVAQRFARHERYDTVFSSCNRNFHLRGDRPAQRWCGQCPKCQFVFLALAPFMPKPRLVAIFGRNLLDSTARAADFDALIEYGEHKPFECVGEGREARAAFFELARRAAWREDALVRRFRREIAPHIAEQGMAELLEPRGPHGIPDELWMQTGETL